MRGLFFTLGLFAACQGMVCLGVDSLTVTAAAAERVGPLAEDGVVSVPAWFGTTLLATGVVTLLYSVALPKKA